MTDYKPPCQTSDDSGEAWFVERDGRQYIDEPVLTLDEISRVAGAEILEDDGPGVADRIDDAVDQATDAKLKANLLARRKAKDACFADCYIRLKCLAIALESEPPVTSGIWGGYTMEEIRAIRRERDARRLR